MKKTYIGECEHLQNCCITDDECLKRYIHIVNPKTNNVECLVFCNDYLKLNSQKKSFENFPYKERVLDFIELKVFEYLGLDNKGRPYSNNSISDYRFHFMVCQRPFLSCYLGINDFIGWYYENPSIFLMDFIREKIVDFLNSLKYEKYKYRYKHLIALSNKLSHRNIISKEDKEIILLELINETFKLTIKNN